LFVEVLGLPPVEAEEEEEEEEEEEVEMMYLVCHIL
jgi:hypothetical protein